MWTRRELKEKAKQRFKVNYWKCVLVAILMAVLGGGAAGAGSGYTGVRNSMDSYFDVTGNGRYHNIYRNIDERMDDAFDDVYDADDDFGVDDDVDLFLDDGDGNSAWAGAAYTMTIFLVILIVIIAVTVVVLLVVLPLEIFIVNPLEVGINRFFVRNLNEQPGIKEICYAFDHGYMNCVKTLFFRDLFVFLWSLLFLIPGIIKSYEYRMIPYILGETPNIPKEEAFALSRAMMTGNKWKAFVLDLSFLGWYILSGLTFGILGIFYVNPYVEQTSAALYQKLKSLRFVQTEQPVNMM